MRTYAQLTTSFVVFCNRVGVDESISFWGGSEVIAPSGRRGVSGAAVRRGPVHASTSTSPTSAASASRCRCCATSGPELVARELAPARSPSGPGSAHDTTAERGAEDGLRRRGRAGRGAAGRATTRRHRRCSSCPTSSRSTPTSRGASSPSSSAASCARRASSGRCSGLSGGIDSALVAYLVAEAIGAEQLLCVLMPYRTSSPASRGDAEEVVRRLGCASELVEITPMVDGYFGADGAPGAAGPRASRRRRCGGATSWPGCG